jgi:predicted nucleotidyltransferase
MKTFEIIRLAIQCWCRQQTIDLCVLFGSQATGKARAQSDVDLALWPQTPLAAQTKLGWMGELEDLLERPVSVVVVSPDLDPVLGFEIVRHGRVLFERQPGLWPTNRLRLWQAYTDSEPCRRAARQHLHRFAESVRHGA